MKTKAHIVVNAKTGEVECKKCKETRKLSFPASVDDAILQMQAFGKSHEYC